MAEKYDLDHLIYIGEQYETERKLSRWSLDGGLALAVLRDLAALQSEADRLRKALDDLLAVVSWRDAAGEMRPEVIRAGAALSATQQYASPVQPAQKTEGA